MMQRLPVCVPAAGAFAGVMPQAISAKPMSDGFAYLDIIFFAMVAAFIALRLRSVLGRRTGNERQRADALRPTPPGQQPDNVVPIPERAPNPPADDAGIADGRDSSVKSGLTAIRLADRSFDLDGFLQGAKAAFSMIVEAYANGDKDVLRPLLAPDVFQRFSTAMDDRSRRGETLATELVATRNAEVVSAGMSGSRARLTVRFESDQINVTRNTAGDIVDGDPSRIDQVVDLWTFERDTRARDPNWQLVETRTPA
jgi:predicted lipid-binding transport protein (Tim44 family)